MLSKAVNSRSLQHQPGQRIHASEPLLSHILVHRLSVAIVGKAIDFVGLIFDELERSVLMDTAGFVSKIPSAPPGTSNVTIPNSY